MVRRRGWEYLANVELHTHFPVGIEHDALVVYQRLGNGRRLGWNMVVLHPTASQCILGLLLPALLSVLSYLLRELCQWPENSCHDLATDVILLMDSV